MDDAAWRAAMAFHDPVAPDSRSRRGGGFLGFLGIVAIMAGMFCGFAWRDRVVAAVPPLARAFAAVGAPVNVRGLEFRAVRAGTIVENGQRALLVEGDIVSLRPGEERVPDRRFALRRPDGRDGYRAANCSWSHSPFPGETGITSRRWT
eukprot:gene37779-45432_t